jgi:uncharacterized membrane protein YozB (DUF420 family)
MDYFLLIASISLIVQIVTLSIVISGYILKRKMQFRKHGTLMLVAIIMQFTSFLLIMGPAFVSLAENGLIQKPILVSTVTIVHASLGGVVLAIGIWIAASWHLRTSIEPCIKKKWIMRYLIIAWISALILGITLYALLYWIA